MLFQELAPFLIMVHAYSWNIYTSLQLLIYQAWPDSCFTALLTHLWLIISQNSYMKNTSLALQTINNKSTCVLNNIFTRSDEKV